MPRAAGRFPLLENEPRSLKGYSFGVAPPPYRSSSSSNFHEEDSASALWSEHSYNSGQGSGTTTTSGVGTSSTNASRRRASWTNLVEADENYPKVASTASSAFSLPPKQPIRTHHNHTSSTSSSNLFSGITNSFLLNTMPSTRGPLLASRENSLTASVVSDTFVYPKGPSYNYKMNEAVPTISPVGSVRERVVLDPLDSGGSNRRQKKDRMDDIRRCWRRPISKLICLGILLLIMAGIIVAIVLSQVLVLPSHFQFSWQSPANVAANATANVVLDVSGDQARFELTGNQSPIFKNSYVSVLDFKSNKVAIIDSALRASGNGNKNLICFLMDLNRQKIPDLHSLQQAAKNSEGRTTQTQGWAESWTFNPIPLNTNGNVYFDPQIPECNGSRWIQLSVTNANQKNVRCSECYDFCLPEYGVERDPLRAENVLNIANRDCFYLFVPEWRNFALGYTNSPQNQFGQNQFGLQQQQNSLNSMVPSNWNNMNMNQQNMGNLQNLNMNIPNQNFGMPNQQNMGMGGGVGGSGSGSGGFPNNMNNNVPNNSTNLLETRWINLQPPLQNVPQQITNATEQGLNQLRQNFNQWGQNLGQNIGQTVSNIGQNIGQTVGQIGERIGQNTLLGQAFGLGNNPNGQNTQNMVNPQDQSQLNLQGVVQSGQRTYAPNQPYGQQISNYQFTGSGENAQQAANSLGLLGTNYNSPLQPPQNYPQPQGLDSMNSNYPNTQTNPFASNSFSNNGYQNQNPNPLGLANVQPVQQNFIPSAGLTTMGGPDFKELPGSPSNPIVYPPSSQNSNSQTNPNQPLSQILSQPSSLTQQAIGSVPQPAGQPPPGYLGNPGWNNVGK